VLDKNERLEWHWIEHTAGADLLIVRQATQSALNEKRALNSRDSDIFEKSGISSQLRDTLVNSSEPSSDNEEGSPIKFEPQDNLLLPEKSKKPNRALGDLLR